MRSLRVLIVEDTENDAVLVLRELSREAYDITHLRVDTRESLRAALRAAEWDLVISDFSLPSFTAMDVLAIVAESGLDLPCIVISGTIEEEAAVDALKSGADDFISKDRLARLVPAVSRELREAAERRQRRAAEAALDKARDRMRFALEAASVGTWESDIASGRTEWSDLLERLHGQPGGSFAGTFDAFIHTIHVDDRERVLEAIARATREHTETRLEYRVVWPDGSTHWIAGVGQTFYDDAGQPVRAAGVGLDITAQKRLEEQFRQAQRMESVGNLAGGIAHDFNNILTAILGYTSFLLEDDALNHMPDRMRSDLEEIRKAGERAAALTSQLLAFSRKQVIQPTILSINAVIENFEPMVTRLIGEHIDVITRPAADLGAVRADVGQLEQVIMNLVVNARDAMPDGGTLMIETANVELDEAYAKNQVGIAQGSYVMLAVSDTGTGMTPELQARIFEPFFTTKPKGRGTGLGLATIYGIVKQNNGYVWVYSEPGKGSTFKVYLPRADEQPSSAGPTTEVRSVGGNETILLVEDDDRVRTLASMALRQRGHTLIEATNGEEALLVAARHNGPVHLLLTDVVMPGLNGQALAQKLSERYRNLRVLYMSGYTDNAIVQHDLLTPRFAFLQKPFTPASLVRAVRQALDAGA